jgi:hypothetical protein
MMGFLPLGPRSLSRLDGFQGLTAARFVRL